LCETEVVADMTASIDPKTTIHNGIGMHDNPAIYHGQTSIMNTTQRPKRMRLAIATIPTSDVDRAKRFYSKLGWRLDTDFVRADGSRAVQLTPPGSPASIQFGTRTRSALHLVVSDLEMARAELINLGIDVSDPWAEGRLSNLDPERRSVVELATFNDPDGNTWLIQELARRLPKCADQSPTFSSSDDLAGALRRAAAAHGEYEKWIGQHDINWPEWYAEYIIREQNG
jgi:catechol 2,3-dioxygenase-like lactoylglutathione lyase family enzyme